MGMTLKQQFSNTLHQFDFSAIYMKLTSEERVLTRLIISQHWDRLMAWCSQATSHYLNQCWHRSMSPYGVTNNELKWSCCFQNPHKRHLIAGLLGWAMRCPLWVSYMIYILPQSLQWCVQYCVILDNITNAHDSRGDNFGSAQLYIQPLMQRLEYSRSAMSHQ